MAGSTQRANAALLRLLRSKTPDEKEIKSDRKDKPWALASAMNLKLNPLASEEDVCRELWMNARTQEWKRNSLQSRALSEVCPPRNLARFLELPDIRSDLEASDDNLFKVEKMIDNWDDLSTVFSAFLSMILGERPSEFLENHISENLLKNQPLMIEGMYNWSILASAFGRIKQELCPGSIVGLCPIPFWFWLNELSENIIEHDKEKLLYSAEVVLDYLYWLNEDLNNRFANTYFRMKFGLSKPKKYKESEFLEKMYKLI